MPYLCNRIDDFFCDFETPYGYGGPITNCADVAWVSAALSEMRAFFIRENYVAGFIRFHPLLNNVKLCGETIPAIFERSTIFIDLSVSLDDIWSTQISSKNRNTIRKAEKSGLVFIADFGFEYIEAFIQLYNKTMNRIAAESFYYFPKDYYTQLKESLQNNSLLGIVKKDGCVVAAAIFMFYSDYGHYHLAGSDQKLSSYGVNNFLIWNTIKILREKGVNRFHLGGGTNSRPDNSLFKFKKTFSNNRADYYIGKIVFNEKQYSDLCAEWEKKNPEKNELYKNRLFKYRY
jgi:lipid II:glycine glycyltransferase (peptidoglycan interpeptide bridge formation enzyme)